MPPSGFGFPADPVLLLPVLPVVEMGVAVLVVVAVGVFLVPDAVAVETEAPPVVLEC